MLCATIGCAIEHRFVCGFNPVAVARNVRSGGFLVEKDAEGDVVIHGELGADNGSMAMVSKQVQ